MYTAIRNAVKKGITLQQIEAALRENRCSTFILARYPRGIKAVSADSSMQMRYNLVLIKKFLMIIEILEESNSYAENFEKLIDTGFSPEMDNSEKSLPKIKRIRSRFRTISDEKFKTIYKNATVSVESSKIGESVTDPQFINSVNSTGETFLTKSCRDLNYELFLTLIASGANLHTQNLVGECALSILVEKCTSNYKLEAKCSKFIIELLWRGAHPKIGGANEIFLINMLIEHKWEEPVFLAQLATIINKIGDINRADPRGLPVLLIAAVKIKHEGIRLQTLRFLLQFGASPWLECSESKKTAYQLVQSAAQGAETFDTVLKLFEIMS